MGHLFNGGGTSVADGVNPPAAFKYQFAAWLNGVTPDPGGTDTWGNFDDSPTFNLRSMLLELFDASPYANVEAVDPTEDLDLVKKRFDAFLEKVHAIDPALDIENSIRKSVRFHDEHIRPESNIADAVDAFELRTRRRHLQAAMRVRDGYGMADAGLSSTMRGELVAMEADRAIEINDYEQRLLLQQEQIRTQWIETMTARFMQAIGGRVDAYRAAFQHQFDFAKLSITAKQDRITQDIEYEVHDAFWNPNLIKEGFSGLQLLNGTPMIPKAPTKAERFIQQVLTTASFAAQLGTALGSPALGLAGGAALLGLNIAANRSQG